MEIITSYPQKNTKYFGFPRLAPIKEIIIHGTGGNLIKYPYPWAATWNSEETFLFETWHAFAAKYATGVGLFHFLVGSSGKVWETLAENRWAYHASIGGLDAQTIGIENFNLVSDNQGGYSQEQMNALFDLIKYLMDKYPTIDTIAGHGARMTAVSQPYKICPGPYFSWNSLYQFLNDRGYTFEKKTVTYQFEAHGETRIFKPGTKAGEYLINIVKSDEAARDSASDKKTQEEIVEQNTVVNTAPPGNADVFKNDPPIQNAFVREIITESFKLKFTNQSGPSGITYLADIDKTNLAITTTYSTKVKIETKAVIEDMFLYVFSPAMLCPFVAAGWALVSGGGQIVNTVLKCKADNKLVFNKDCVGTCMGIWVKPPPPAPPTETAPCSCTVEFSNSGQSGKTKGM